MKLSKVLHQICHHSIVIYQSTVWQHYHNYHGVGTIHNDDVARVISAAQTQAHSLKEMMQLHLQFLRLHAIFPTRFEISCTHQHELTPRDHNWTATFYHGSYQATLNKRGRLRVCEKSTFRISD